MLRWRGVCLSVMRVLARIWQSCMPHYLRARTLKCVNIDAASMATVSGWEPYMHACARLTVPPPCVDSHSFTAMHACVLHACAMHACVCFSLCTF